MANVALKKKQVSVIGQDCGENRIHLDAKTQEDHLLDTKTKEDYLAFFTEPQGADMLPYVYRGSSKFYDDLVRYSKDYYLFKEEADIIASNQPKFTTYLAGVKDIVEIGPGCDFTIENKTLPILSNAPHLEHYHAIDISRSYLDGAMAFIKSRTKGLQVSGIEADLMTLDSPLHCSNGGFKCVLFLGSTLGNVTDQQQNHMIKQIARLTAPNDMLILTVDTNQEEASLLKAYSNAYMNQLIKGVLTYFSHINHSFIRHILDFEVEAIWNQALSLVDIYFVAKKSLSFEVEGYGPLQVLKGQKLRGVKSRKPTKQTLIKLLNCHNFDVIDILTRADRMQMFICRKFSSNVESLN